MKQFKDAFSDGDAYESNDSGGIYTAGISMGFREKSKYTGSMDKTWMSRIECHGESKEDAEELRDAVLAAIKLLTTKKVVCISHDGFLRVHSESETCGACSPSITNSEAISA